MKDTTYKFDTPLRIALLADLHDRPFEWITQSLKENKPEIIAIAGDVIHHVKPDEESLAVSKTTYVLPFLKTCAAIAPTFLSLGNHEWVLHDDDLSAMAETGVTLLDNSYVSLDGVLIGGLTSAYLTAYREYRRDKPERYPEKVRGDTPQRYEPDLGWLDNFCKQDGYKILLCHHPEYRDRYLKDKPIDMILCGHAHGGQIRLFGRGLFAPGQGVLPKYTSGVHENMIISKGMANTGEPIPRLFNPREVVYIEPK